MDQQSKSTKDQDQPLLFTPQRVELIVKSNKETNGMVKMGQESRWTKRQNKLRIKTGYCCLTPERVQLTVNSKSETNGRVKMGQESRLAAVVYPQNKSN